MRTSPRQTVLIGTLWAALQPVPAMAQNESFDVLAQIADDKRDPTRVVDEAYGIEKLQLNHRRERSRGPPEEAFAW